MEQNPNPIAEGPKEGEVPKEIPKDARREDRKEEVKYKYADEFLEDRNITAEEGREILGDPAKLRSLLEYLSKSLKAGHKEGFFVDNKEIKNPNITSVVGYMLDAVNPDTAFLKQIIETYVGMQKGYDIQFYYTYVYLCNCAVKKIDLVDDEFFKGVFEKSEAHDVKVSALGKIQDQAYVASVEDKYRPGVPHSRYPHKKARGHYDPTTFSPTGGGGHKSPHRR